MSLLCNAVHDKHIEFLGCIWNLPSQSQNPPSASFSVSVSVISSMPLISLSYVNTVRFIIILHLGNTRTRDGTRVIKWAGLRNQDGLNPDLGITTCGLAIPSTVAVLTAGSLERPSKPVSPRHVGFSFDWSLVAVTVSGFHLTDDNLVILRCPVSY